MNKDFIVSFKAIFWKELRENIRMSKFMLPFSIILIVVMMYFPVSQTMDSEVLSVAQKKASITMISIFIPFMVIPFIGNTIVFRSIYDEKRNKTIQVLLASGISPSVVWLGKMSVATTISYIANLIAVIGFCVVVKFNTGIMVMNVNIWIIVFIIMPVLGIGVLSIISVSYWWFKNGQVLGLLYPIITLVGIWNYVVTFGTKVSIVLTSAISIAAGVILIGLSFTCIHYMSKERIVNV
jgi:ABC-type Na+ efflux pump permease subunit